MGVAMGVAPGKGEGLFEGRNVELKLALAIELHGGACGDEVGRCGARIVESLA